MLQIGMGWLPEQAGGLNRYYYDLLRHLPRPSVRVHGLVAGPSVMDCDSGECGIRAFAPSTAPLLTRWWALRRELRQMLSEKRPDLIVSHFALYTLPILDLIRRYPLVIHFHGSWALEAEVERDWAPSMRIKASLERAVYQRSTCFIVLSRAFRDILCLHYGVPSERIRVIPGGVDVDRFASDLTRQEARERLGWPQDRPIVLTVRRLVRRMGLEDLIVAIDDVRTRIPEALLMVGGDGPLAEALVDRVKLLGLRSNVQLLGFITEQNLPTAYRAADLTVVPSVALEGFGLVILESLAAGTPALVTPVGGLPEVVHDLSPALVLPTIGASPLSEALVEALMGGLVLPSAQACRDYARAYYDWPVVAARVREVYSEALR